MHAPLRGWVQSSMDRSIAPKAGPVAGSCSTNPSCICMATTSFPIDPAESPTPKVVYVKAGRVFDGTGDSMLTDRVIVVEGERIKAVGSFSEIPIPGDAKVIDLSKATVLPGLIDAHTHLGSRADRYDELNKF